ncbi:MAG: hypothetical protein H6581_23555 [Bacteroidia bacterium]|nr:hypothetical protein [Bacteroidia bacterium]
MFQMNLSRTQLEIHKPYKKPEEKNYPTDNAGLESFLKENPGDVTASVKLSALKQQNGDGEGALGVLQFTLNHLMKELEANDDSFALVLSASSIFEKAGNPEYTITLLEKFIEVNPESGEALAFLAMQLALRGELDRARKLIDQAYEVDPAMPDVYSAEWLFQWYSYIIKASQSEEKNPAKTIPLRMGLEFLEKAQKEHPDLLSPKMITHSLMLTRVLVGQLMEHTDDFIEKNEITLKLDKTSAKEVAAARKYFENQIACNPVNPYFLEKNLVLAYLLEGNYKSALECYEKAFSHAYSDTDIFRIMCIGEVIKARYLEASKYLTAGFAVMETGEGHLLYARLLYESDQIEEAANALAPDKVSFGLETGLARAAYLIKNGNWEEAGRIMDNFSGGYDPKNESSYRYLDGILSLAAGDRESAKMSLYTLKEDEFYQESIQEIFERFGWDK